MTLRQLEYLVAVAELGSFSAAARRLHVAQPAVSQQLRKLETELGTDLVTRTSPLRLTTAGEEVTRHAAAVLNEAAAIRAATTRVTDRLTGQLSVGVMHWLGHIDVPATLGEFAQRHPDVQVSLVEQTTPDMVDGVRTGELDLTFLSLLDCEDRPHGVRVENLGTEALVIAGGPGTLPECGNAHLRFLHDRPFIAFADGMNLRSTVDAALDDQDVVPRTVVASNEPLTVRDLAAQGLGFALVPAELARRPGSPLDVANVHAPGIRRHLGLAWRSDRRPSAPAQAFIELVRERYAV